MSMDVLLGMTLFLLVLARYSVYVAENDYEDEMNILERESDFDSELWPFADEKHVETLPSPSVSQRDVHTFMQPRILSASKTRSELLSPSAPQTDVSKSVPPPSSKQPHSTALVSDPMSTSSTQSGSSTSKSMPDPQPSSNTVAQIIPKLSRLEEGFLLKGELSLVKTTKVICSMDLLLKVFTKCQHPGCTHTTIVKHHFNGPTAIIKWFCSSKEHNGGYTNNLQLGATILIFGNNFAKIEKFAHFLGLKFISDSTFYHMQLLYLIPAINEWWSWQREELLKEFLGKKLIMCGDGQCDSPGHNAKNLCYFLMELVTGYILEVEVRDKRHVSLASSNMEKQALQNALQ